MSIDEPCVFCGLMRTGAARWVAKQNQAVAFLPLPESALAPGHTLVVSRAHCVGVFDAPPEALGAVIALVQQVAQAMLRTIDATGVVVLNASGSYSGQSVDHLHFHVVPCWPDDEAELWPADRSAHPDIPGVHERLASHLE